MGQDFGHDPMRAVGEKKVNVKMATASSSADGRDRTLSQDVECLVPPVVFKREEKRFEL